ncbi:hypothetical protein MmTuc01_2874 [Methanosarcina mazei Tuc01]|uniref:Uncharacterized protein n=1 Tax=Methanosarcina mazei Tuc01 TaxID=1236903 RepID=M1Q0P9_METMZ|nr:hypothetical protein MmTuc01_2874 [Methanosarcina mazei Tuc01]
MVRAGFCVLPEQVFGKAFSFYISGICIHDIRLKLLKHFCKADNHDLVHAHYFPELVNLRRADLKNKIAVSMLFYLGCKLLPLFRRQLFGVRNSQNFEYVGFGFIDFYASYAHGPDYRTFSGFINSCDHHSMVISC